MSSQKVWSVIVTYHPNKLILQTLLQSIEKEIQGIVIVDNGSDAEIVSWLQTFSFSFPYLVIPLQENKGIAYAQNIGIRVICKYLADYVILFDHDSQPSPNMISLLLEALYLKVNDGHKVAAVGPRYIDRRQNNPPPFIKVIGLKVLRQKCSPNFPIVEVDYLIASGSLIPISTLNIVGGMRDELFIDYVDIEWGLRAKSLGYQSFGVCNATMSHDLGDTPIKFLGKQYPLHSPLRHYYHFRNAIWMYQQPWLPMHWKFADAWRLILKYGFYTLFAQPRIKQLLMMTRGVLDGLKQRMGKLEQ